ncbi:hypothetical protein T439DRAFT_322829 [Meredithblackwellia eburnea MCA 4105]
MPGGRTSAHELVQDGTKAGAVGEGSAEGEVGDGWTYFMSIPPGEPTLKEPNIVVVVGLEPSIGFDDDEMREFVRMRSSEENLCKSGGLDGLGSAEREFGLFEVAPIVSDIALSTAAMSEEERDAWWVDVGEEEGEVLESSLECECECEDEDERERRRKENLR